MAKIEQETTRVVHLSFTRLTTLLDKASATVSWWKDILFLETSALTGENVQAPFLLHSFLMFVKQVPS